MIKVCRFKNIQHQIIAIKFTGKYCFSPCILASWKCGFQPFENRPKALVSWSCDGRRDHGLGGHRSTHQIAWRSFFPSGYALQYLICKRGNHIFFVSCALISISYMLQNRIRNKFLLLWDFSKTNFAKFVKWKFVSLK